MLSIHGTHKSRKCIKAFRLIYMYIVYVCACRIYLFLFFVAVIFAPFLSRVFSALRCCSSCLKARTYIFYGWLCPYRCARRKWRQTKFIFALLIITAFHISFDVSTKYKYQTASVLVAWKIHRKYNEKSLWTFVFGSLLFVCFGSVSLCVFVVFSRSC